MPKFRVSKGQDAYIVYEAIIEAESFEAANDRMIWDSERDQLTWTATGEVITFDTSISFPERTISAEDGEVFEPVNILNVSDAEKATIIAALRYYQEGGGFKVITFHEIASDLGHLIALDEVAIDQLCERINS